MRTVDTTKGSAEQRAAIQAAADDNHDSDAAARVTFGRVELHAGLGDQPLERAGR